MTITEDVIGSIDDEIVTAHDLVARFSKQVAIDGEFLTYRLAEE